MLADRTAMGFSLSCLEVSGSSLELYVCNAGHTLKVAFPPEGAVCAAVAILRYLTIEVGARVSVVGGGRLVVF